MLWAQAQELYSDLWRSIVRPPRDEYSDADLGAKAFRLSDGRNYRRTDFEVQNHRNQKIVCSHFEPDAKSRPEVKLPAVIYLHGNCSSRVEAATCISHLLPLNITVIGFDFTGSGQSDGEYVTLGWNEKEDLREVILHVMEHRAVSQVALWGRSMGAVTALLYAAEDPMVSGIVCDSPFSNLRMLAEELAEEYLPVHVPKFVVGIMLNMLKNTIKQKAGLDIDELDVMQTAQKTHVPALFVSAYNDQLVQRHHGERLYSVYKGDKWLVEVNGDHNSARSDRVMNTIAIFFYNCLHCTEYFHGFPRKALLKWNELASNAAEISLFPSSRISAEGETRLFEQRKSVSSENTFEIYDHERSAPARGTVTMRPPERPNPSSTTASSSNEPSCSGKTGSE